MDKDKASEAAVEITKAALSANNTNTSPIHDASAVAEFIGVVYDRLVNLEGSGRTGRVG